MLSYQVPGKKVNVISGMFVPMWNTGAEAYSEFCQASKVERIARIVRGI